MNKNRFYKRARGIYQPAALSRKRVMLVGNGSGGSFTSTELGRLGTSMILIDRPGERLEEHNIFRHACGYSYLGWPKTLALAAHIRSYNPAARITTAECDVLADAERFEDLVLAQLCDLILDCVDDPAAKHVIGEVAFRHNIPLVGAGVFDGGVGAEVYRALPGGACYSCIATALNLPRQATRKRKSINYDNPDRNEARSTSALNLHIVQAGTLHAQVALNTLLGEKVIPIGMPPQVNIVTFANRVLPNVFSRPWHAEFFAVPRDSACLVCGGTEVGVEAEAQQILRNIK